MSNSHRSIFVTTVRGILQAFLARPNKTPPFTQLISWSYLSKEQGAKLASECVPTLTQNSRHKVGNYIRFQHISVHSPLQGKAKVKLSFLAAGQGGLQRCEMSSIPHFLDTQHTYGGEVVSLTCQSHFTPSPPDDSWCSWKA
jgi:hypothetical protein